MRDREELLAASFTVATADEVKSLFLEYQAAGVSVFQTLKRQPWARAGLHRERPDGQPAALCGPAE